MKIKVIALLKNKPNQSFVFESGNFLCLRDISHADIVKQRIRSITSQFEITINFGAFYYLKKGFWLYFTGQLEKNGCFYLRKRILFTADGRESLQMRLRTYLLAFTEFVMEDVISTRCNTVTDDVVRDSLGDMATAPRGSSQTPAMKGKR